MGLLNHTMLGAVSPKSKALARSTTSLKLNLSSEIVQLLTRTTLPAGSSTSCACVSAGCRPTVPSKNMANIFGIVFSVYFLLFFGCLFQ